MTVTESGMEIELDPATAVQLDKHADYTRLNHLKAVDFLIFKDGPLIFAEFKSTAPMSLPEKGAYVQDVLEKYLHSFLLFSSFRLGRQGLNMFPGVLANRSLEKTPFRFVLVVKRAPMDHLTALQNDFQMAMKSLMVGIGPPVSVFVINEVIARKRGWVT